MLDPSMTRHRLWQSRLDAVVSARLLQPMAWGLNDCCQFAAQAVDAVLDVDLALGLRGTYDTQEQAQSVLASLGGAQALLTQHFGPPVAVLLGRPGDVGTVQVDSGATALAVCLGSHWVAPAPDLGLVRLRARHIDQCWRVGA